MDTLSQKNRILEHLFSCKTITPIDALRNYGCFRLAARISDLRREGYDIRTTMIDTGKQRYAKYSLDS